MEIHDELMFCSVFCAKHTFSLCFFGCICIFLSTIRFGKASASLSELSYYYTSGLTNLGSMLCFCMAHQQIQALCKSKRLSSKQRKSCLLAKAAMLQGMLARAEKHEIESPRLCKPLGVFSCFFLRYTYLIMVAF